MTPVPHATRLWLPPLTLAGCARAVVMRDTRDLPPGPQDNYFAASPYVSIYFFLSGTGTWLSEPGFVPAPPGFEQRPCMVGGVFDGPVHTRSDGPGQWFLVALLPDAFSALTGIAPDALRNRCADAQDWLPPDWLTWAAQMAALPDDDARLALLQDFLLPRWQALTLARPVGRRFGDWVEALAVRAATSSAGRSLRQVERRVKAWAGMPLRELRTAARTEAAYLDIRAQQRDPNFDWADAAASAGYADQSHLCRETRRVSGFSPEELRQRIDTDEAFWPYRIWE